MNALMPGRIGALWFPYATEDKLMTVSLFLVTFFLYDDVMENGREPDIDQCILALSGKLNPDDTTRSFIRVMCHLGKCFEPAPELWKTQFLQGMRVFLESIGDESLLIKKMQEMGEHPGVDAFWKWRTPNLGANVVCLLAEFVTDNYVSFEKKEKHEIQIKHIWNCCNIIMMCQNDYVSAICGKDDNRLNLGFAMTRTFGFADHCSVMLALHNHAVMEMHEISRKFTDEELLDWSNHLKTSFTGIARYHESFMRYKNKLV